MTELRSKMGLSGDRWGCQWSLSDDFFAMRQKVGKRISFYKHSFGWRGPDSNQDIRLRRSFLKLSYTGSTWIWIFSRMARCCNGWIAN